MSPNRPWYGVRYLLRDDSKQLYQEDIVLIRASTQEEALTKGEKQAEDFCESMPEYVYTGYAEVFHIFEETLGEGVEVYSILRSSDLDAMSYIKRFLRAGSEKGFTNSFD